MKRIIPRPQWFQQPFVKNILANTLGTIIGIVLTLGTTYLVTNIDDRKNERQQVKMLVRSLDNHIEKFEGVLEFLQASDSVNGIFMANRHDLSAVADSTLTECLGRSVYFDTPINDFTAAHIFESNIETWRTIRSVEFIETMGKCFALSQMMTDYHKQINEEKRQLIKVLYKVEREGVKSPRDRALRYLNEPEVINFMRTQHELYVLMMGQGVYILKQKNEECKKLAGITDDD